MPAVSLPHCSPRVAQMEPDGTLKEKFLEVSGHAPIERADAVARGYLDEKAKNYCAYPFCPHAAANKTQKCGAGGSRTQEGRARAPCFCIHPNCRKGFHASCWSLAHKHME